MATDKPSFILYRDLIHTIEKVDDSTAGKLFKHILEYVNDKDPEPENILISVLFEPIKQQLKRDLRKYELRREKNRENAFKRWDNKKQDNAIASDGIIRNAKHAVNGNVNVNVNDNVNDILLDNTDFNEKKLEILENRQWIEITAKSLRLSKVDTETLLDIFLDELESKEDTLKPVKEIKSYFVNWAKIDRNKKLIEVPVNGTIYKGAHPAFKKKQ